MKSRLYAKKESSYNVPKNTKRTFFQALNAASLFAELNEAVALFTFIIELARTNTDPLNSKLHKKIYFSQKMREKNQENHLLLLLFFLFKSPIL